MLQNSPVVVLIVSNPVDILTLPPDEQSALVKSAAVVQEAIEQLELAGAS